MAIVGFTGFETGSTVELSTVGTGASVQSTVVASGGYALLGGTTVSTVAFSAAASASYRFAFRKSADPAATFSFFRLLLSDSSAFFRVGLSTAGKLLILSSTDVILATGTTTLANDTFYDVGLVVPSTVNGIITLSINGVTEATVTRSSSNTLVHASVQLISPSSTILFYFDDIVFENTATLPPAVKVIKAQGKTGLPTYDAFTKNGALLVDLCWSDTPVNAATNCSSATSGAAQTMLVESVTTRTGADATIHGARVALVAKSSSVTKTDGAANIRRRVSGVDTNTAITLTTADALYQTPIFTETLANLDTSEIGFLHGANIVTQTVEDVWLMVAYEPSAAPPPPPPPATTNYGGMFFGAA